VRYDGENLADVLTTHSEWVASGGEYGERADFSGADLAFLNLAGLCLYGADMRGANLYSAVLCHSDLRKADLTGANLRETCLEHAQLRGALGIPYIPLRIPDTGAFIAWKRVNLMPKVCEYADTALAMLLIPEDARRTSNLNGECRADKAVVLEIQALDGTPLPGAVAWSIRDRTTKYVPGETVVAANYDDTERYTPWTPGIYFYPDREEAVQYLTRGRGEDGGILEFDWSGIEKEFHRLNKTKEV